MMVLLVMSKSWLRRILIGFIAPIVLAVGAVPSAHAGEGRAKSLCEDAIKRHYGVDSFRNVWADRTGHYKYDVHGEVREDRRSYPFNCKVKGDYVKSYYYNGPHKKDDDNGGSKLGTALAIGAGIAIIAALASKSNGDDDYHDYDSSTGRDAKLMEDDCHDELVYRLRHEHREHASVVLKTAKVRGRKLSGEGKVRWQNHPNNRFNYTCYFDSRGHIRDSEYQYY